MGRNGIWTALALLAVTASCLIGAACGSDDSSATTVSAAEEGATPGEAVPPDASEMEAIESTIKTWVLHGGCDLMTDHFLEEQTFSDDRAQACKTFEAAFTAPSYSEEDIEVGDITYANDKATATVGDASDTPVVTSGGEPITSTYKLVLSDDGTWQINSADVD